MHEGEQTRWIRQALAEFERPLLRYAASITGDAESARDVVQETFLKLCAADRAAVEDRLAAWLYTVCRNHALNVRKKEARMTPLIPSLADNLPDAAPSPGDVSYRAERLRMVVAALETLDPQAQEACRLKFQNQLTYREIADVMGVSLGTVANLVTRALDTVRERVHDTLEPVQEV